MSNAPDLLLRTRSRLDMRDHSFDVIRTVDRVVVARGLNANDQTFRIIIIGRAVYKNNQKMCVHVKMYLFAQYGAPSRLKYSGYFP